MAVMNLAQLKRSRASRKVYIDKLLVDLQTAIDKDNVPEVERHLAHLEIKEANLCQATQQLEALTTSDSELDDAISTNEAYAETIIDAKILAHRMLTRHQAATRPVIGTASSISFPQVAGRVVAKLPKLFIRKFEGAISDWERFHDQFKAAVDSNTSLTKVDKFNYLKGFLAENASLTISGLSLTDANYDIALDLLRQKYGQTDVLVAEHVKRLLETRKITKIENGQDLRLMMEQFQTHLRSLENLGKPVNALGTLLCPVLLKSLPHQLIREWHRKHGGTANDNLPVLLDFIKSEVEGIELACRNSLSNTFPVQGKDVKRKTDEKTLSSSTLVASGKIKTRWPCIFCTSSDHFTSACPDFKSCEARTKVLKKQGRCLRCLQKTHDTNKCDRNFTCKNCQSSFHHSIICPEPRAKVNRSEGFVGVVQEETLPKAVHCNIQSNVGNKALIASAMGKSTGNISVLQTIRVWVKHATGYKPAVLLLDGGSEKTFVSQKLVKQLNIPARCTETLVVHSFGGKKSTQLSQRVSLSLVGSNQLEVELSALVVPEICTGVSLWENSQIELYLKTHKQRLNWAQAMGPGELVEIDILIGADFYWHIVSGHMKRLSPLLMAIETKFGWTLQGNVNSQNQSSHAVTMFALSETDEQSTLQRRIEELWELDRSGTMAIEEQSSYSQEDVEVLENFEKTTEFSEKRYYVNIPWNQEKDNLCHNFFLAKQRLKGLLKQLHKTPLLYDRYCKGIYEYLSNKHTEEVTLQESLGPTYLMPHHPIVKEDRKTTKLRIVFDASSHDHTGKSLNDCQYNGPNLNPNILDLLLRFRWHKIGVTSDIQKAFLQIGIKTEDRDATRFLWTDGQFGKDVEPELKIFRMTRVLFGMKASPFLLAATIRLHLKRHAADFPEVSALIDKNIYVDDLVSGAYNTHQALFISVQSKTLMDLASMPLTKWATNSTTLREQWIQLGMVPLEEPVELLKVLGLMWDPTSDMLFFKTADLFAAIEKGKPTKRHVLEILARIFDPLGIITPKLITVKLLLQDLWRLKVSWDEPLAENLQLIWEKWLQDLSLLQSFRVERWYHTINKISSQYQLHVFCDASIQAYGAVAYLRILNPSAVQETVFIASKARVAPLKVISIPRLELLACLIGARLAKTLMEAWEFKDLDMHFWTDSQVALQWVRSTPSRWKVFVARRVQEIQALTKTGMWHYCISKENPADIISRGQSLKMLNNNSLWLTGPKWLNTFEGEKEIKPSLLPSEVENVHIEEIHTLITLTDNCDDLLDFKRFSKWSKIMRISAWVIRFLQNCRKAKISHKFLTAKEIKNAELYWFTRIQVSQFPEELHSLKENKSLKSQSSILQFQPFLDRAKVMRLSGRLQKAGLPFKKAHPVLLKGGGMSDLLILDRHERAMHGGIQDTLMKLREEIWIIKGRQAVRKVVSSCLVCRKWSVKPVAVAEAPLPAMRVLQSSPFESAGVDFCGPIWVKQAPEKKKAYICLFTCAVTRSIHLELTTSQSIKHFILALRRFIARRGACRILYSDNAATFSMADRLIQDSLQHLKHTELQDWSAAHDIEWRFIPPRASWWGGFYERMVGAVKRHLRRTLGASLMGFEELSTLLTEIEATINARPLVALTEDLKDAEPLTPSHFLIGKTGAPLTDLLPSLQTVPIKPTMLRKWRYRVRLMNNFWKQWSKEYLLQLQSFHQARVPLNQSAVKLGDVVLLREDRLPRGRWKMAIVEELFEGRDGRTRSLLLRTAAGTPLRRAVQHICPLEIA